MTMPREKHKMISGTAPCTTASSQASKPFSLLRQRLMTPPASWHASNTVESNMAIQPTSPSLETVSESSQVTGSRPGNSVKTTTGGASQQTNAPPTNVLKVLNATKPTLTGTSNTHHVKRLHKHITPATSTSAKHVKYTVSLLHQKKQVRQTKNKPNEVRRSSVQVLDTRAPVVPTIGASQLEAARTLTSTQRLPMVQQQVEGISTQLIAPGFLIGTLMSISTSETAPQGRGTEAAETQRSKTQQILESEKSPSQPTINDVKYTLKSLHSDKKPTAVGGPSSHQLTQGTTESTVGPSESSGALPNTTSMPSISKFQAPTTSPRAVPLPNDTLISSSRHLADVKLPVSTDATQVMSKEGPKLQISSVQAITNQSKTAQRALDYCETRRIGPKKKGRKRVKSIKPSTHTIMMNKSKGNVCCMPSCLCNQGQSKGVSFCHLPQPSNDPIREDWRIRLLRVIKRRSQGSDKFNPRTAKICTRHFKQNCLKKRGPGYTLVTGSLPTEFLDPAQVTKTATGRKEPMNRTHKYEEETVCYTTFEQLKVSATSLPFPFFQIPNEDDSLSIGMLQNGQFQYQITVKSPSLIADVMVLGIATGTYDMSLLPLQDSLHDIMKRPLCPGISDPTLQDLAPLVQHTSQSANIGNRGKYHRIIQTRLTPSGLRSESTVRSHLCNCYRKDTETICDKCMKALRAILQKKKRQLLATGRPIKKRTPLSSLKKEKLQAAYKTLRDREKKLLAEIEHLKKKVTNLIDIDKDLREDLEKALNQEHIKDPFARLFWQQEKKAFTSKNHGMRWHPMMIRLAIMLHCQSPAMYASLRETCVLKLPGKSTLRNFTNYYHPDEGFQWEVLEELRQQANKLPDNQKWIVLLHDEMQIQSDLVFDAKSGRLIGFINRDNWIESSKWVETAANNLATHALCFMAVGINSSIKQSIGFFATKTATAHELMPKLWQAISYMEGYCGLKVIASTSDKASPNQKLYKMHGQPEDGVCYKSVNHCAPDRDIFFFSDAVHLMKTIRNNIYSSGSDVRHLWNNGKFILWRHIVDQYWQGHRDERKEVQLLKLTKEHLELDSYSTMNVKLAVQVLSNRVGSVLQTYGPEDSSETAHLLLLMNEFFDCLNVRSKDEGWKTGNKNLYPYRDINDPRFKWLIEVFLEYFHAWDRRVQARTEFKKKERNKMFLTYQNYEGLQRTVHAFIEATQYLLSRGVKYVLSGDFNQDPLEEHFSRHRMYGRRCTNPNLWTFGYQEQKIRIQRTLALQLRPRGKIAGEKRQVTISDSPLKCRRY